MLRISVAHCSGIWVDIGGGTGWNVEQISKLVDIGKRFKHVYIVDVSQSLCQVARQRIRKMGWANVTVVCQDAATFRLPDNEKAGLVTMSYSLSMVKEYYKMVDHIMDLLDPVVGRMAVVDFSVNSRCSWISRVFWQHWFEVDQVYLDPSRRQYLKHKLTTRLELDQWNHFLVPHLIQIPYYIWVGSPNNSTETKWVRHSYDVERPEFRQFSTYIYAFTWEDPQRDLEVLDLKPDDSLLVITSGGDNVLEYMLREPGVTINCVDMNPCQNHLLELKLSVIQQCSFQEFWQMFGAGKCQDFLDILDTRLSKHLSAYSYEFWQTHHTVFTQQGLYKTGFSGLAIRCWQVLSRLWGIRQVSHEILKQHKLSGQIQLWKQGGLFAGIMSICHWILNYPTVTWKLLGVPTRQFQMLQQEGSMSQYVRDTIDSVAHRWLLSSENYFYHLLLNGQYSEICCPSYMAKENLEKLKQTQLKLHIHTSTILEVLKNMETNTLTKGVLMDHMDWFTEQDAELEIKELHRVLKPQGQVIWRSASRQPWYIRLFEANGYTVKCLDVRQPNTMRALDRVNMYASLYQAIVCK